MADALKRASETFAAAPKHSQAEAAVSPGQSKRDDIVRNVRRFEENAAQWRAQMLKIRQDVADMYKDLSELPIPAAKFDEQVHGLDEFIERVDHEIETERLALERGRLSGRQTVATLMKSSSDNAHFAKKF